MFKYLVVGGLLVLSCGRLRLVGQLIVGGCLMYWLSCGCSVGWLFGRLVVG